VEVFLCTIFGLSISLPLSVSSSPSACSFTSTGIEDGPGPTIASEFWAGEIAPGEAWCPSFDELPSGSLIPPPAFASSSSADDDESGSSPSCHLRMLAMRFLRPR
jgi:hypothetical protein